MCCRGMICRAVDVAGATAVVEGAWMGTKGAIGSKGRGHSNGMMGAVVGVGGASGRDGGRCGG